MCPLRGDDDTGTMCPFEPSAVNGFEGIEEGNPAPQSVPKEFGKFEVKSRPMLADESSSRRLMLV